MGFREHEVNGDTSGRSDLNLSLFPLPFGSPFKEGSASPVRSGLTFPVWLGWCVSHFLIGL